MALRALVSRLQGKVPSVRYYEVSLRGNGLLNASRAERGRVAMYLCPGSTRLSSHMVELGVAWVTTVLFCLLPSKVFCVFEMYIYSLIFY